MPVTKTMVTEIILIKSNQIFHQMILIFNKANSIVKYSNNYLPPIILETKITGTSSNNCMKINKKIIMIKIKNY